MPDSKPILPPQAPISVVPDQTRKLEYLIRRRTDQRPRDNKGFAINDPEVRIGNRRVVNQNTLAGVLGVNAATVSRWIARASTNNEEKTRPVAIPPQHIDRICYIYRIRPEAFYNLCYDAFVADCLGDQDDWLTLVTQAELARARFSYSTPGTDGLGALRFAELASRENDAIPNIPVGAELAVEFESPAAANGGPAWADWQVLLFNHNKSESSFKCYLPRYGTSSQFAGAKFLPNRRKLMLPNTRAIHHPGADSGIMFERVLLVCKEPLPDQLSHELSRDIQGPALNGTLLKLAEWIKNPLAQGKAALARAPYLVVEA